MKFRLFIVAVAFCATACNSGLHETVYKIEFNDGTSVLAAGYAVNATDSHYIVQSVYNDSMFDKTQVKAIYPETIVTLWNPLKN